ncbi:MAG: hypothetical protein HDS65_07540 [Bacteroidales bacterium]|nr:hypothetical protein [Bacteroidales bacterium]
MKDKDLEKKQDTKGIDTYPGVAVNYGDDGKCDKALEKERTRTINNNPRNNEIDE